MKKRGNTSLKVFLILFLFIMSNFMVSAINCQLGVNMINQDPYPAVPGDYVKLVFQVTGTSDPDCKDVFIELLDNYPISFDPGVSHIVQATGGTYVRDYNSYLIAPFKVRLDENALDGENKIEVKYGTKNINQTYFSNLFNLEVKDTRADFEVYIKDYNSITKELTFEILNTADVDVKAVTINILKQDNANVIGASANIVGDLDSNEYTTADFTAGLKQGEIKLNISYSDSSAIRRSIEKNIYFDPSYFTSETTKNNSSWYMYLIYALIICGIVYYIYRRLKKKKEYSQRRSHARLRD